MDPHRARRRPSPAGARRRAHQISRGAGPGGVAPSTRCGGSDLDDPHPPAGREREHLLGRRGSGFQAGGAAAAPRVRAASRRRCRPIATRRSAPAAVGDPVAVGRPARHAHRPVAGRVQRSCPCGSRATSSLPRARRHEQPAGRPGGVAESRPAGGGRRRRATSQAPPSATTSRRPGAGSDVSERARGLRRRADHVVDPVAHLGAGRGERERAGDRGGGRRDGERARRPALGAPAHAPRAPRCTTCQARRSASAARGGRAARSSWRRRRSNGGAAAHAASSASSAASRSSARRSRELTVPRGSSSSCAISPGVYSSRWRSTTAARWSGSSAAERGHDLVRPRRPARSGGRLALDRLGHLAPQRPRARPVDRPVDDDPVQPGTERPAPVEAVERPDRGEEGLLGDVLRGGRVVHDQEGGPVRRRPVRPEERLHRLVRARLRGAHPGALAPPRRARVAPAGPSRAAVKSIADARARADRSSPPRPLRASARREVRRLRPMLDVDGGSAASWTPAGAGRALRPAPGFLLLPARGWRKLSRRGRADRRCDRRSPGIAALVAVVALRRARRSARATAQRAREAAERRADRGRELIEDQRPRRADAAGGRRARRIASRRRPRRAAAAARLAGDAARAGDRRATSARASQPASSTARCSRRAATPVSVRAPRGAGYNCFALTSRTRVGERVLESGYRFSARAELPAGTLAWCKENPRPLHPTSYVLSVPISPECR